MEDCIFCKLANGIFPTATVYEDENFRVILDVAPATEGHALILPKKHYRDLEELPKELAEQVFPLARKIGMAQKQITHCKGFNVVQNNGSAAGQTVFHFHVHIIPRYENGPDMVNWIPQNSQSETLKELADQLSKKM